MDGTVYKLKKNSGKLLIYNVINIKFIKLADTLF